MQEKSNSQEWITNTNQKEIYSGLFLENNFKHAFFTKKANLISTNKSKDDYISSGYSISQLKQIHSNKIIYSRNARRSPWPEGDGLISSKNKRESLWIYSADCIPILFANKETGQVLAIHAGWKGIANKILINALHILKKDGSKNKDLIIALGPSISISNYKVDLNLVKKISHALIFDKVPSDKFKSSSNNISTMIQLEIIKKDLISNKYLLDIKEAAINQLLNNGLNKTQISINKNCTFSEEELFFSWRRTKERLFQWSYIESK